MRTRYLLALCGVLGVHGVLFGADAPATRPATQPTVVYDKFTDATVIIADLGDLAVSYGFPGKSQPGVQESLTITVPGSVLDNYKQIIFLIDDDRRIPVGLPDRARSVDVSPDLIRLLASARSVEYAVIGAHGRNEGKVTPEHLAQLRCLLDKTGYYSPDAIALRENAVVVRPHEPLVFVIDATGSMLDKFDTARACVGLFLDHVREGQPFNIVVFQNDRVLTFGERSVPVTPEMRKRAHDFMAEAHPFGSGTPVSAIIAAGKLNARTVMLLTDGDFGEDGGKSLQLVRGELLKSGAKLIVIYLGAGDSPELRAIARDTGGAFDTKLRELPLTTDRKPQ